jgi:hypothetical protein
MILSFAFLFALPQISNALRVDIIVVSPDGSESLICRDVFIGLAIMRAAFS